MGPRNSLAAICLLHAVVGGFTMGNAQAQPPPPPQQLTATVSGTVSTVITVAISAFFVLVFFCVLVNQCRSSEDAGPGDGGGQGSNRRRRRGLDPAAVAALPIVPYAEIRKHKSGVLECAMCLTEFDGGDDLRLLPQCSHAFHPDCIDPWLEGHVTCPLCRANLEKQPAPSPAVALSSSPETEPQTPEAVAALRVEVESDEDERREEAVELERLRSVRRAARMPRSHSTGHSLSTTTTAPAPAEVGDDHEKFTVRLPPHVREEVLKSRRLRHATSLVAGLGSSRGRGGSSWHGARRWPSFLARTVSWARGGVGEGSVRRGGVGADNSAKGTALP